MHVTVEIIIHNLISNAPTDRANECTTAVQDTRLLAREATTYVWVELLLPIRLAVRLPQGGVERGLDHRRFAD